MTKPTNALPGMKWIHHEGFSIGTGLHDGKNMADIIDFLEGHYLMDLMVTIIGETFPSMPEMRVYRVNYPDKLTQQLAMEILS